MLGIDNQLALVGLKVFPVVILGGLDSIAGAVIGGLIVGVVENLAAGYLDPYVGGGTKDFAPYVLMILVLMIRPEGIFGRRRMTFESQRQADRYALELAKMWIDGRTWGTNGHG